MGRSFGNLLLAWRICPETSATRVARMAGLLVTARRWRTLALAYTAAQGMAKLYSHLPIVAIGWLFGSSAAGLYAWAIYLRTLRAGRNGGR